MHTHATIDYAGVEQAKATLVDLAEDGMAVNFGKRLPPTCKVYFQFQLPGQTAKVRLSGQVMWQDWNGRAGIQFVDVPQASRRILNEWLQRNLSDATTRELAAQPVEVEHSINRKEETVASRPQDTPKKSVEKQETKVREREAVARLRAEPNNRRGQTRYACRLGAEVYQQGSSVRNYCHLSDLSPGGCYLEMPLAFRGGVGGRDHCAHARDETALVRSSESVASRLRDGYLIQAEYQGRAPRRAAAHRLRGGRGGELYLAEFQS